MGVKSQIDGRRLNTIKIAYITPQRNFQYVNEIDVFNMMKDNFYSTTIINIIHNKIIVLDTQCLFVF